MSENQSAERNARILVIDDQENIHHDYRKIIGIPRAGSSELDAVTARLFDDEPVQSNNEKARFEIDSAFQGEEGYRLVQKALDEGRPYAMAFVDIRMPPGWDGIETVQRIWEIDPEILIVFCSAYSDYSWESMVERLGRTDRFLILKKPFDSIEVRQFAMALTERWNLARTDVLTNVMNRWALREHLQREWARCVRHELPFACLMLDLDFFKRINDEEGHSAGDHILKVVAATLQGRCRANDLLFRYGGEEFCVLLPHTTEEGAETWAENARQRIADMSILWHDHELHVTASFGAAQRREEMQTAEMLVESADLALRLAKRSGRNRVVCYSEILEANPSPHKEAIGLFQGVVARDVMSRGVATLESETTVGQAARFFLDGDQQSVPIINGSGKLVGMISEIDVMAVMLYPESWTWPISRVAQSAFVCFEQETPVEKIFDFLSRVTMRRVVIVSEERPVGTITRTDLLRWFSNWVVPHAGVLSSAKPTSGHSKVRLLEAVQSLAKRATKLCDELSSMEGEPPLSDDLYGPLVGTVSTMQDLLRDILTFSSYTMPTTFPLIDLPVGDESVGSQAASLQS